jgi:hypothetical protein
MQEKFNLVGKNIESKREGVETTLKIYRSAGEIPFKGELEKTEREKVLLNTAFSFVNRELAKYNIERPVTSLGQVHIYEKRPKNQSGNSEKISDPEGTYDPSTKALSVFVERDKKDAAFFAKILLKLVQKYEEPALKSQENFFDSVIHEDIHNKQFASFSANANGKPWTYRTGYDVQNKFKPEDVHSHFRGFNEAVTTMTVWDIVEENRSYIENDLHLDLNLLKQEFEKTYLGVRQITEAVILKVALSRVMDDKSIPADISAIKEAIKIKEREFWEEIKKGQFTGNMMFLREIEKSVGPGSLRILASVDKENYKEYIDYFLLPTSEEELQKKLAAEILKKLPEREQEAYWNHVEKMTKKDESL